MSGYPERAVRSSATFVAAIALIGACTGTAGATRSSGAFRLDIINMDGPTIRVLINDRDVAIVSCGQVQSLAPGGAIGPTPWTVKLDRVAGSSLGSWPEQGTQGPRQLLIRGPTAQEGPAFGPEGPEPASPCAT